MSKRNVKLLGYHSSEVNGRLSIVNCLKNPSPTIDHRPSTIDFVIGCLVLVLSFGLSGCDRGATEQVQAAQKFADAVVRNNNAARDSMIASNLFQRYFDNPYVSSDFIGWMRSLYDLGGSKFLTTSRADVDRDLKADLTGGLKSGDEIEETGMVRVKSPTEGQQAAYFWMVKQKGHHWAVAMVTKGEAAVNFK